MRDLRAELAARGLAVVRGLGFDDFAEAAAALGAIAGEELIALRPGAHAYVAKPGAVPLHTDHPDVDVVAWWCAAQDLRDGASLLIDTAPIVERLDADERAALRQADLRCPPLSGGPPSERQPILRQGDLRDRVFVAPWLIAVDPARQPAVDRFRDRIQAAARAETIEVRLAPGDALFVDNTRLLHGRRALPDDSGRRLRRLWITGAGLAT